MFGSAQPNIEFAKVKIFLSMEGIPVLSSDVGGTHGRKIMFIPKTGQVFVKKLVTEEVFVNEEKFKKNFLN